MSCRLCGESALKAVANRDAKTAKELIISMCFRCGLVQQSDIPAEDELKKYYSNDYRLQYKKTYTPKAKHVYRAGKMAMDRIDFLADSGIHTGQLLDIGAGGSEFVYLAKQRGFTSKGIEPNIGYSTYAAKQYNADVVTGDINSAEGLYDVVTLFHVMEHLSSPYDAFRKLHSLLKPNGKLLIEVPWIETYDASPNNIFFKAHLYYFSAETLVAFASQYFDVIKVDTTSNLRVLFTAKDAPTDIRLPEPESVRIAKRRMKEKGWVEYLLKGKGLLKPLRKMFSSLEERQAKGKQPIQILDDLLDDYWFYRDEFNWGK